MTILTHLHSQFRFHHSIMILVDLRAELLSQCALDGHWQATRSVQGDAKVQNRALNEHFFLQGVGFDVRAKQVIRIHGDPHVASQRGIGIARGFLSRTPDVYLTSPNGRNCSSTTAK